MILGKLLFAGKSVVNGSKTVSYRENKQVALPKFVSPKNPFAPPRTPAETASAPAENQPTPGLAAAPKAPIARSNSARSPAGAFLYFAT